MNLLTEQTPDYITVGGLHLHIKTDFEAWVRFLIAVSEQDGGKIMACLNEIFGKIPLDTDPKELMTAIGGWLWQCEQTNGTAAASGRSFDFAADGNIIFCELWEHFPHLMEHGVTFPQGIELVKLLIANESTVLAHRAFARTGNFSKMSRETRQYWQKERAKYALKQTQSEIDDILSRAF